MATLFSVTGDDVDADELLVCCRNSILIQNILCAAKSGLLQIKIGIVRPQPQMMRLDAEVTHFVSKEDEELLLQNFKSFIKIQTFGCNF